jgi:hypothetical protein
MMVMLTLLLVGLLFVAVYIVATLIEEKRDETWGPAAPGRRRSIRAWGAVLRHRRGHGRYSGSAR